MRMYPPAAALTVAASIIVAGCASAQPGGQTTATYQRLGTIGEATVYGQYDGSTASILIKRSGNTLCAGSGPLTATATETLCNGYRHGVYVYAQPVAKTTPDSALTVCTAAGQHLTLTRISTPRTWTADLAVRIDNGDDGPDSSCT